MTPSTRVTPFTFSSLPLFHLPSTFLACEDCLTESRSFGYGLKGSLHLHRVGVKPKTFNIDNNTSGTGEVVVRGCLRMHQLMGPIVQSSYQETFGVPDGGRMKHSCGSDLVWVSSTVELVTCHSFLLESDAPLQNYIAKQNLNQFGDYRSQLIQPARCWEGGMINPNIHIQILQTYLIHFFKEPVERIC